MKLEPYTLQVPCAFLVDYNTFMQKAAELGQFEGRDDDWYPSSLDAAIFEVLLFGISSEEYGVIFMPSDTPIGSAYRCPIEIEIIKSPAEIEEHGEPYLPSGWHKTFDNTLMALLNSDKSPNDYGVMIDEDAPAVSNHQHLADRRNVASYTRAQEDCPRGSIFAKPQA